MTITLDHIYSKLLELEQKLSGAKLGFQSGDRALKYVYCQLTNGNKDGWYELVGDDRKAITLPSVYWGVVENIDFKEVTRRNKDTSKFRFWLNGEDKDGGPELVIFEAGAETFFARTILAAMSRLSPAQLKNPIRVSSYIKDIEQGPNAGDRTLAVSLSFGDGDHNKIDCGWKSADDWQTISRQAIANVRAASGYVPKEEREAAGDCYSQPQQQGRAPAPPARPQYTPPAPPPAPSPVMHQPTPPGQGMTNREILFDINTRFLRMENSDMGVVVPLAMNKLSKVIGKAIAKADDLNPEEFVQLVDLFLIGWADQVQVRAEGAMPTLLYPGGSEEQYRNMIALYQQPTHWKKAEAWAIEVDRAKKEAEAAASPQQEISYGDLPW